jgi:predicted small metal-binding protein
MRVIECDECGETIQAATDDELTGRLADHLRGEHGIEDADAGALVADEAYDATDS